MKRILVIEDDPNDRNVLRHALETAGYDVQLTADGTTGIESFQSLPPAAVILDLSLPGQSGKKIARQLTQQAGSIPVIVLSEISDVADKVLLLELGADDYVTKPFSTRELLARLQVALRRSHRRPLDDAFAFDDVLVEFSAMKVTRNGKIVRLTAQEFKLLKFLLMNRDRVLSRDELLKQVWGYDAYPSTKTVDNHFLRLRRKLEKDPNRRLRFCTVHSVGYKFAT